MGNKAKELGVLAVKGITRRGANFVGGVPGLILVVQANGKRSWALRYKIGGVRRDMGLGSFEDVSLATAWDVSLFDAPAVLPHLAALERVFLAPLSVAVGVHLGPGEVKPRASNAGMAVHVRNDLV